MSGAASRLGMASSPRVLVLYGIRWGSAGRSVASLATSRSPRRGRARRTARLPDPIPYQRFVLDNGLTLIVHEDHKAPIVAVNVWYHVGSKNERPGKTGFAHLFEHLMFQGSEHCERRVLQGLRPGGRDRDQRDDRLRPHQLLPERPELRARRGALDGIRSDGAPARRDRPGAPRRAARRGPEREAPGRGPALRQALPRAASRAPIRRAIPTRGRRSARCRISTRRRSTTCASGSAPGTARRTR